MRWFSCACRGAAASGGSSQIGEPGARVGVYIPLRITAQGGCDALAHTDPDRRPGRLRRRLGHLSLRPLIMTYMDADAGAGCFKPFSASSFK
jgi:hypothetical protein